jgi:hypothetical protein
MSSQRGGFESRLTFQSRGCIVAQSHETLSPALIFDCRFMQSSQGEVGSTLRFMKPSVK